MLDARYRSLTGGTRRARQRQQTLQAAMDWSHDLLGDDERHMLRRLSVFAGGCTLEAAVAVCAEAGDTVGAIDSLGSLVDKSLVVADESAAGDMRYRMLETVRLYGQDRLVEAEEAEALRDRQRDWMLAWLRDVVEKLPGQLLRRSASTRSSSTTCGPFREKASEQQRPDCHDPLRRSRTQSRSGDRGRLAS
jgi:predicted ATPase